jgi:signal transduction histidine kinase
MTLSLRARFALSAGLLVVVISAAVAAAGYLTLQRSLLREARRAAAGQAAQLARTVDTGSSAETEQPGTTGGGNYVDLRDPSLVGQFLRPGLWAASVGADGATIQASPNAPAGFATSSMLSDCRRAGSAGATWAEPAAVVACRVIGAAAHPVGYVVTGQPLADADRTLRTTRRALGAAVVVGGLVSFVLAWLLARHALRPLRLIASAARSIRAGDLSRRIAHPGRDELGEVARELDASFSELEHMVRRQERFIADASHELKNPLAAAKANVQLLRRWAAADPEARADALEALERSASRMGRIVADLIQLAHGADRLQYARAPVRLDDLLLEVQREARATAGKVEVVVERLEEVTVIGDRDRLAQLLANLIDNAVHVTPPGGSVRLGLEAPAGRAVVTIADDGPGIPADELPHVFDRFFRGRTSEAGTGAGLGLAIARTIALAHGGDIEVTSTCATGSVFTVSLPREVSSDRYSSVRSDSSQPDTVAGTRETR